MNKFKILTYGEVLWDIIEGKKFLGGAPFNLASHAQKLGANSYLISAVGKDSLGKEILKEAKKIGVNTKYVFILDNKPTGKVTVKLSGEGIPNFNIHENSAWDNIKITDGEITQIKNSNFDAFCFGTLAQRNEVSRNSLKKILNNVKFSQVFFDVNIRKQFYKKDIIDYSLGKSTIMKCNHEEVSIISKLIFNEKLSEEEFCNKLIKKFNLNIICITKGAKGCSVYSENIKHDEPGIKIKVADTVGAGDAFSAAFLVQYLKTKDIKKAAKLAVKIGAIVASSYGAIPDYKL